MNGFTGGVEMELSGFISSDYNDWAMVGGTTFAEFMYSIAKEYGVAYEYEHGLGGKKAIIPNVNIVMYTSKKEMPIEEAEETFLDQMFGADGVYEMEANYTGYSEWTITGFDLDKCRLGGHDMNQILLSYAGEYANIRVECPYGKVQ